MKISPATAARRALMQEPLQKAIRHGHKLLAGVDEAVSSLPQHLKQYCKPLANSEFLQYQFPFCKTLSCQGERNIQGLTL